MSAHPLSTSRSELTVRDGLTRLSVWMPLTEMEHVRGEDRKLTRLFRVNGEAPVSERCTIADVDFICEATFLVPEPRLVETHLPERVLPHHLHLLRAGGQLRAFTVNVTQHPIEREVRVPWGPLLIFTLAAAAVAVWLSRNSRWRRNRPPSS